MLMSRRAFFGDVRAASVFLLGTALFAAQVPAQTYHVLKAFETEGQHPKAGLIEVGGSFYGATFQGGESGLGTVFRLDAEGTMTVLHSFATGEGANPYANPILGSDGKLYGVAGNTIYRMAIDGGGFTVLHTLGGSDGIQPYGPLVQGADGNLYGTAHEGGAHGVGTIFVIDVAGTALTTLHDFSITDGSYPAAALFQAADGNFYGTTSSGGDDGNGTVFRLVTDGTVDNTTFTVLHNFAGNDGAGPACALVQDAGGDLYGTTGGGGDSDHGTVFRIDTDGVMLTTLHSFGALEGFNPTTGVVLAADGNLYGSTRNGGTGSRGTLFRVAADGSVFLKLHDFAGADGAYPEGVLLEGSDGKLYGTTDDSGNLPSQFGTVFRLDTDGNPFETLHAFTPFPEGSDPVGELTSTPFDPTILYGTASHGGEHGFGTIFRIGTDGTGFAVLHSFTFSDGAYPGGRLTAAADGSLYGTTSAGGGGGGGKGTVFKFDPAGPTLTPLHVFSGNDDGNGPSSGVIIGSDGFLYGTTESGGANDLFGTVFRVSTDGGAGFTTLHSFDGTDGQIPRGGVIEASDGRLYGTTTYAGANGKGTIYRIERDGGNFVTLHHFASADGANSYAGLIQGPDGFLYGTTYVGGDNDAGTVFKMDTGGVQLTTLHSFLLSEGAGPESGLLLGADGVLYGTTNVGGTGCQGCGTVFRIDLQGGGFSTVHAFSIDEGAGPKAGIFQAADGQLYGTTPFGGPADGGVLFQLEICQVPSAPVITADACVAPDTGGLAASVSAKSGAIYDWTVAGGTIDGGQGTSAITFTSGSAGTRIRVSVIETDTQGCVGSAAHILQADFDDVPPSDPFYPSVCAIGRNGITAGCGSGDDWRNDAVTRAQMAVFLLKAEHGAAYAPPACSGLFADVPCPGPFSDWIEQLAGEGVTAGCGGGNYCPDSTVTRAQMSAFLLKAEHGPTYSPPPCTGVFGDVACPSLFSDWIEQLAAEGVTAGCGNGNFCPSSPNSRGQMAVFLVKTFGLP